MNNTKNSKTFYKINRKTLSYPTLNIGNGGFFASNHGALLYNQLQLIIKAFRANYRKNAKIWLCNNNKISITKKAQGTRLGKGKGTHKYWIYPVHLGATLFEINGLKASKLSGLKFMYSKLALRLKLKVKHKF